MTRPTLAQHETRLALLEQGAAHDAAHDEAMLDALKEIRDEVKALREHVDTKFDNLSERQTKTETRVDKVLGNVRAFGAGMAAAFTLIGTALGAGISSVLEWFK